MKASQSYSFIIEKYTLFLSRFCFDEQIHTSKMTLADDVNLEEFIMSKDEFSGADIKAICTEAGLLALRERRMKVRQLSTPNTSCFSINLLLWLTLLVPETVTFLVPISQFTRLNFL